MDKESLKKNIKDSLQAELDGSSDAGDSKKQAKTKLKHKTVPPPDNLPGGEFLAEDSSVPTEQKVEEKKESEVLPTKKSKGLATENPIQGVEAKKKPPSKIPTSPLKEAVKTMLNEGVDGNLSKVKPEKKILSSEKEPLNKFERIAVKKEPPLASKKEEKTPVVGDKKKKAYIVRTYQSDIAKALKDNNGSVTKIAIAEQLKKADRKKEKKVNHKKKSRALWGSLFFILVGIGVLAYSLFFQPEDRVVDSGLKNLVVTPIIFTEIAKEIDTTGLEKGELVVSITEEIRNASFRLDYMEHLVFTRDRLGEEGLVVKSLMPTRDFFSLVTDRLPPSLLRSFSGDYMFGIHAFNGDVPFIIVEIDFFENAFAGMLKWEEFMADDIFPLFNIKDIDKSVKEKDFKDFVFKNQDMRILSDEQDEPLIVYSFPNKKTLVITGDIDTFDEIIRKLNTPKPISR